MINQSSSVCTNLLRIIFFNDNFTYMNNSKCKSNGLWNITSRYEAFSFTNLKLIPFKNIWTIIESTALLKMTFRTKLVTYKKLTRELV